MELAGSLYSDLFTSEYPELREICSNLTNPFWSVLLDAKSAVEAIVRQRGHTIHPNAEVYPGAHIIGSYIGERAKVYPGTLVRDSIVLSDVSIGHCSEVARSIIGSSCFLPRFNYVGGSLLGRRVQLGGGAMLATERHDRREIYFQHCGVGIATGSRKIGSLIGDDAIIAFGCHINPGTVICHDSWIMPGIDLRGYVRSNVLVARKEKLTVIERRRIPRLASK